MGYLLQVVCVSVCRYVDIGKPCKTADPIMIMLFTGGGQTSVVAKTSCNKTKTKTGSAK